VAFVKPGLINVQYEVQIQTMRFNYGVTLFAIAMGSLALISKAMIDPLAAAVKVRRVRACI
jgi:hypothetical protein